MIDQATQSKLIKIYYFVCDLFEKDLQFQCLRYSNNNLPEFTDQEIISIYLFCVHCEGRFTVKKIHNFIRDYYADWFPKLPSYVAFSTRLNRLSAVFPYLLNHILKGFVPAGISDKFSLLDSMPIITCSGKRKGKVASEITDKGFCSTKNLYYYGAKLHILGFRLEAQMPHPESVIITCASENDLNVFKDSWSAIKNRVFFGDKIYHNQDYFEQIFNEQNSEMLTPVKQVKGQAIALKQWDQACNDLFSKAVSSIRQPIESLFNWLNERTDIQRASKVRSTSGLIVHIFGKMTAAFIKLIF